MRNGTFEFCSFGLRLKAGRAPSYTSPSSPAQDSGATDADGEEQEGVGQGVPKYGDTGPLRRRDPALKGERWVLSSWSENLLKPYLTPGATRADGEFGQSVTQVMSLVAAGAAIGKVVLTGRVVEGKTERIVVD